MSSRKEKSLHRHLPMWSYAGFTVLITLVGNECVPISVFAPSMYSVAFATFSPVFSKTLYSKIKIQINSSPTAPVALQGVDGF